MTEKTYGECKWFIAPFGFFSCTKNWNGKDCDSLEPCKMKECEEIE